MDPSRSQRIHSNRQNTIDTRIRASPRRGDKEVFLSLPPHVPSGAVAFVVMNNN